MLIASSSALPVAQAANEYATLQWRWFFQWRRSTLNWVFLKNMGSRRSAYPANEHALSARERMEVSLG